MGQSKDSGHIYSPLKITFFLPHKTKKHVIILSSLRQRFERNIFCSVSVSNTNTQTDVTFHFQPFLCCVIPFFQTLSRWVMPAYQPLFLYLERS